MNGDTNIEKVHRSITFADALCPLDFLTHTICFFYSGKTQSIHYLTRKIEETVNRFTRMTKLRE